MKWHTAAEHRTYLRSLKQQYAGTFKLRKLRSDINTKRKKYIKQLKGKAKPNNKITKLGLTAAKKIR